MLLDNVYYVVHNRILKYNVENGIILKYISKIISFKQITVWNYIKEYIDLHAKMKAKRKGNSENHFYKLMNNNVFVETVKNIRNGTGITLCDKKFC